MRSLASLLLVWLLAGSLFAQDPGKQEVAKLEALLIFGTDGEVEHLGKGAKLLGEEHVKRLGNLKDLTFAHYRELGRDRQPVWRSYTNWAAPMRGSEEILLSFEPNGEATDKGLILDLELWQSRRKVMKATQEMGPGKWLYIAGPKWRGGRLIVGVELVEFVQK